MGKSFLNNVQNTDLRKGKFTLKFVWLYSEAGRIYHRKCSQ